MRSYRIDAYETPDGWQAVIPDLLIVGSGADAAAATADAVRRAGEAEADLVKSGLAARRADGSVHILVRPGRVVRNVLVEYGTRALILATLVALLYQAVRGDLRAEAALFRERVATEVSLLRQAIDGTLLEEPGRADRLKERARRLNERLMPIAEELRPLMRALFADEPADRAPAK